MSGITAALNQIDEIGAEGNLDASTTDTVDLDVESLAEPIRLPDGRDIYMPTVLGRPIDEVVCRMMDKNPARSLFLRLIGPPGVGKSAIVRAIAWQLWQQRGRELEERDGAPFYGFIEVFGGPSSDEWQPFRQEFVPDREDGSRIRLVDSPFVTAMRFGWVTLIDETNVINERSLLTLNSCFDGRALLTLPSEGISVTAAPGWFCCLAYNPQLVSGSSTDIPDAWRSRFPATLEVTSNWAALLKLGAPQPLVAAAARLDQLRLAGDDGLVWTPQFRELLGLTQMMERLDERLAIGFFCANLHEQLTAGTIQEAEAVAACGMLDEAGYGRLRISATSKTPTLHGYQRAVTR